MPLSRASKSGRAAGECGVKRREPKQIGSHDVGGSWTVVVGAAETENPTQICPTVGANCRGLVTTILVGEGTGFRDGTEAALVVPSANKEKDLPRFRPPERKTLLLLV